MSDQSATPTFRYTQLAAKARITAMSGLRDFTDELVTQHQTAYAEAETESFNTEADPLKLASKTNAAKLNLLLALDFQNNIEDDFDLLTFLKYDTLEFSATGELVKASFSATKPQILAFEQYKGDFYTKYHAETDNFYYLVIKMHSERVYTARRQNKTDKTPVIETTHSSLPAALKWLREHHAKEL